MARTPEQNIARREKEAEAKRQKRAAAKAKAAPPRKPAAKKKAPVKAKGKRKSPAAPVAAKVPVKKGGKVAQSKPVAAKSKAPATPVAKKPATPPPAATPAIHTMERSYLRSGAPGAGMLRGKNYQATVTFTEEQFLKLRDKASFNNRSLAEQIRWSVIQQQAK